MKHNSDIANTAKEITSSSILSNVDKDEFLKKITEDKVIVKKIVEGFEKALSIALTEEEKELFSNYWREKRL